MSADLASINPTKTDAEKAEAYRKEMGEVLKPVCDVLERSRKDGLIVGWNLAPDEFGRYRAPFISITKPL